MYDTDLDVSRRRSTLRQQGQGLLDSLPKGLVSLSTQKKINTFLAKIPAGEPGCTVTYPGTRSKSIRLDIRER
jgi:hypothetical protein